MKRSVSIAKLDNKIKALEQYYRAYRLRKDNKNQRIMGFMEAYRRLKYARASMDMRWMKTGPGLDEVE